MDAKRLLRSRLSAQRAAKNADDVAAAGARITALGLEVCRNASTVAAYASLGNEPPTGPLLDALRSAGVVLLLPVVDGARLDWARYEGTGALVTGRLGIGEPAGARLGPGALRDADVVLVPAVAVDGRGRRLGRGAGYYDRALADVEVDRLIAVVYDDEVVDAVPVEPHDRPVGRILTPAGVRSVT